MLQILISDIIIFKCRNILGILSYTLKLLCSVNSAMTIRYPLIYYICICSYNSYYFPYSLRVSRLFQYIMRFFCLFVAFNAYKIILNGFVHFSELKLIFLISFNFLFSSTVGLGMRQIPTV